MCRPSTRAGAAEPERGFSGFLTVDLGLLRVDLHRVKRKGCRGNQGEPSVPFAKKGDRMADAAETRCPLADKNRRGMCQRRTYHVAPYIGGVDVT